MKTGHDASSPGEAFTAPIGKIEEFPDSEVAGFRLPDGSIDPRYVIHAYKPYRLDVVPAEAVQAMTYEERVAHAEAMAEAVHELEQYGIPIPPTYWTVGESEDGQYRTYAVSQRLQGANIGQLMSDDPEKLRAHNQQIAAVYGGLIDYYADKYHKREPYLYDSWAPWQFVLHEGNQAAREGVYYGDTEALRDDFTNGGTENGVAMFAERLGFLQETLRGSPDLPGTQLREIFTPEQFAQLDQALAKLLQEVQDNGLLPAA